MRPGDFFLRQSEADAVPVTSAVTTTVTCGCGATAVLTDPLAGWTCPVCGNTIPGRGDVVAKQGRRVMSRNNWGEK